MAPRIQSPSSILTYKLCPRKYYYQYIEELPTKPSIHLIRGKVAHSVLENFFKTSTESINDSNYEVMLKNILQNLLVKHWKGSKGGFDKLNMTEEQLQFYFDETMMMVLNWANNFFQRIRNRIAEKGMSFKEAFRELTPLTEKQFISEEHKVQGFIDAIEEIDGKVKIVDYKTSKRSEMKKEYKLQLAIYALLYFETHKKMPHRVAINFLRDVEKYLDVTKEMIEQAKHEIKQMHLNTVTDDKKDYPKKPGPLCNWSTGQCDFFDKCFKSKQEFLNLRMNNYNR